MSAVYNYCMIGRRSVLQECGGPASGSSFGNHDAGLDSDSGFTLPGERPRGDRACMILVRVSLGAFVL